MTAPRLIRDLGFDDYSRLKSVFDRFRREFAVWADQYVNNWELLAFVQYEGIDLPIVREAEPLIKGEKCVELHGARWCMIAVGAEWHFGITHADLVEPVDLSVFNRKRLNRSLSQRWKARLLTRDRVI